MTRKDKHMLCCFFDILLKQHNTYIAKMKAFVAKLNACIFLSTICSKPIKNTSKTAKCGIPNPDNF